jgi:hypothetical protein
MNTTSHAAEAISRAVKGAQDQARDGLATTPPGDTAGCV